MRIEFTDTQKPGIIATPSVWNKRPTFEVSFEKLEKLKNATKRELREVKHTHRLESLARGLGWESYDAMRAEVYEYTVTATLDGKAFTEYLASEGYSVVDPSILERAVRRTLKEVTKVAQWENCDDLDDELDIGHVTDIFFRR